MRTGGILIYSQGKEEKFTDRYIPKADKKNLLTEKEKSGGELGWSSLEGAPREPFLLTKWVSSGKPRWKPHGAPK